MASSSRPGAPDGEVLPAPFSRPGYIPQLYNGKDCPACAPLTRDAVDVTAGATVTGKNFALKAGGLISGRVTATGGGPIAGVRDDLQQHQRHRAASRSTRRAVLDSELT